MKIEPFDKNHDLSQQEMVSLYSIAIGALDCLRHDMKSKIAVISNSASYLSKDSNNSNLQKLDAIKHIQNAAYELKHLTGLALMSPPSAINQHPFWTRPGSLIDTLASLYHNTHTNIFVSLDSDYSLEITYPNTTLYLLYHELINNVHKHVGSNVQIQVSWAIDGFKFRSHIHNAGIAPVGLSSTSYIPLDMAASLRSEGEGLHLLWRVISQSGGMLLFRRSPILGGLEVLFDFPVYMYHARGAYHRSKDS